MIRLELQSDAAGRPVVLLHGRDSETCSRLVESFRSLADVPGSVPVQGIPGVVASDGCELIAVHDTGRPGVRAQGNRYLWSQNAEGWRQVADLLAPFGEEPEGGSFQFLEDKGDATIIYSTSGQW